MNSGPPPFGFTWRKGRLVREPGQAETLVRMFELFVDKRSKAAVAKALNAEGRRTSRGSKWTDIAVLRGLSSEAAMGRHFANTTRMGAEGKRESRPRSEWVEFPCEPIINQPLWEKVQQLLEAQRSGIPVPRQSASPGQPFDGLLFCVCGSAMKSDAEGKRYRCPKCRTTIEAADLDGVFESELASFLEARWDIFSEILGGNTETAAAREQLREGHRQHAERVDERQRIEDLFLKKHIDLEKFGKMETKAKEDILEIERDIRRIEGTLDRMEKQASSKTSPAVPTLKELRKRWRRLGATERHAIASALVDSLVLDGTHLTFSYKFADFVEDAVASRQIEKPTNPPVSSGSGQEPRYIRLPKSGTRCPLSGLTRSKLNQLILAGKGNGFRPPVRSIKPGGSRLILWASLRDYLDQKLDDV